MHKIAAILSGGGSNLRSIIAAIDEGLPLEVAAVIATSAKAKALEWLSPLGIDVFIADKKSFDGDKARQEAMADYLIEREVELIVLCGCKLVLAPEFVAKFPKRIINIHPSLLPKYAGRGYYGIKVHEAVIAAKESHTGASVHFVDEGVDTGELIMQESIAVLPDDSPESLQARVFNEVECKILPKSIMKVVK